MTATMRLALVSSAGAIAAALLSALSNITGDPFIGSVVAPDILSTASISPDGVMRAGMAAIAGGLVGLALAAGRAGRKMGLSGVLLAINPLVIFAFARGADSGLFLAAAMIVASAAAALAVTRDYRACIILAFALAFAPFVSSALLYLYPALIVLLPALSPWGLRPRKILGFSIVIWSPLAMTLGGLVYLNWLLGGFARGASLDGLAWREAYGSPDLLLIAAGAAIVAAANARVSRLAAALAFVASAGLLVIAHPEWLIRF